MKRTAVAGLKIDVLVDSENWKNAAAAYVLVRRAVKQAATTLSTKTSECAIVLTDDAAMRKLNRNWRGIDATSAVLSFTTKDPSDHLGDQPVRHLGAVLFAYE